jgi:hypothetical protein
MSFVGSITSDSPALSKYLLKIIIMNNFFILNARKQIYEEIVHDNNFEQIFAERRRITCN